MTAAAQNNYELSIKLISLGINCEIKSNDGKIFTDYSSNEYYNNYFLFDFKNYDILFSIYKDIKEEYIKNKSNSIIKTLFDNLYYILNLNLNESEKIIKENLTIVPYNNILDEYSSFQEKCIYLKISPTESFINILISIFKEYKEKNKISDENIEIYNKEIECFQNILNKNKNKNKLKKLNYISIKVF